MSYTYYSVAKPEGHVAVVTLMPEAGAKVFQFSQAKLRELVLVVDAIESDRAVKVVVFTGSGKVFAAGADITEMRAIVDSTNAVEGGSAVAAVGHTLMDRVERSRLVSIAAINGAAVGGACELCLACDYRVAVAGAKLGQPEINLGLIPGWGGTRRLARLVGPARAKWLVFTGELITAETALDWGLVQEVVAPDQLVPAALGVARTIGAKSGQVLAFCKEAIHAGLWESDEAAELAEQARFGQCFGTEDTREGLTAFLAKRPAVFKN